VATTVGGAIGVFLKELVYPLQVLFGRVGKPAADR
jgi:hypothetical protein